MMSNCAFWSAAGELLAVHGHKEGPPFGDPAASFGPWAASLRLPAGRLVALPSSFPLTADQPGWQLVDAGLRFRVSARPRACDSAAPVAVFAPSTDVAASTLWPSTYSHPQFEWRSWPTWVTSVTLQREEGPEGWYAALEGDQKTNRFLVRLVPHRGRLPGDGWRNMLLWALRSVGLRLVPLRGLPRPDALAAAPAWEYRVEAGRGTDAAAWDVQVLPTRSWLTEHSGQADPWAATALVRWVRPGRAPDERVPSGEPTWAELFGRWQPADARLVVQNALQTRPGGAASLAPLFYDAFAVTGEGGVSLLRTVPQPGLPLSLLSVLFGKRAWAEVERAKRRLPSPSATAALRSEALADLDQQVAEGRLVWSLDADALWARWYREPRRRRLEAEVRAVRASQRWDALLAGDLRVPELVLRRLDVTDAALCLRDVPDGRWRRFVTARREAELRAELAFIEVWDARGELTPERELEAWQAWDELATLES